MNLSKTDTEMLVTEQENLHSNVNDTNKQNYSNENKEQLTETEPIEGTPFTLVKFNDLWHVCIGHYRLTEGMTKLDAYEDSKREDWIRVMQVMGIMIENYNK